MSNNNIHSVNRFLAHLILVGSLFCVVFGQGLHIHSISLHVEEHFDVHAHMHAHESHDEPRQTDQNQEKNKHQHEVSTASDIIGTLTTAPQVKPDLKNHLVFLSDARVSSLHLELDDTLALFGLPPPRPVANQYLLPPFSLRGPPIA